MTPLADPERYKNHRFPGEIISHGVWLYYRFPLSYRDVQELLFERGVDAPSQETSGTSMRCSSRSMANAITCGGR
jgi:transposase-like protein